MFTLPSARFTRGFTIIELMVTVAVLGVLSAIAAPSFTPLLERWQVRQVSEELQSTLYFARSEAVKRGGEISILRIEEQEDCTTSETNSWNCGWVVFHDKNNDGKKDDGEEALQVSAPSKNVKIKFTDQENTSLTTPVIVDRWGVLSSNNQPNFVFRLTPKGSSNTEASASSLCVNGSGRIKRKDSSTALCT